MQYLASYTCSSFATICSRSCELVRFPFLQGAKEGEREPKVKKIPAVLGVIFLATGYGLALFADGIYETIKVFLPAVLLVILRLTFGPQWAAEGVFMLFAVLFTFIGAQFIGMGLLGEYIGRIYTDVRARPRYFVQQVIRPSSKENE